MYVIVVSHHEVKFNLYINLVIGNMYKKKKRKSIISISKSNLKGLRLDYRPN